MKRKKKDVSAAAISHLHCPLRAIPMAQTLSVGPVSVVNEVVV
jgi:hypothetical protein